MPTPSETGNRLLEDFIGLRDSLRRARIGHGGREVCEALTASLDRAVASLVTTDSAPMALVALGGYGRGELSPFSDVDLMLLHELGDASDVAADLFRPLWDAKLQVGHAVRTVKEAAAAARDRFDTQTTLLTGRLVAGSPDLFDRLMAEVAKVTKARPLRRHLVAAERERRSVTPYPVMALDIKTGRGGLRALQGFEWERRREELIGRFSTDHQAAENEAREVLLRVRNALHAVTGRRHDVFSPELREPAARWLGRDTFDLARELVAATNAIDRMAERKWPEMLEGSPRPLARRVWSRGPVDRKPAKADDEPDLETLDGLLGSGERGRATFDQLWETGRLDRILPEWSVVADLPQLEPFHVHPVAAHLWRTVAEIDDLAATPDHLGRIAAHLDRGRLLRLAAFLHDIGKGHGGDHAVVGGEIVKVFAARTGLGGEDRDLLVGAVRHHLLLAITATRRDLDDPAVIEEVADEVGSLTLLQVLYLLTIADSKATGPTMWNAWKETLLRTLFMRCAKYLESGDSRSGGHGTSREEVMTVADGAAAVAAHVDAMPPDYLRTLSAGDVLWHVDLVESLEGASNLDVRRGEPFDTVVVAGPSRPGFRHLVAAALAANGIDVLEARMFGRADGVLLDSFRVRDDRTGGRVPEDRWARVRSDVEAGLIGELDTGSKLAGRAAAYPVTGLAYDKPTARISDDPATGEAVIVVKCSDRMGRLAEILQVLDDCGLEIRLAKLDSREGEVVDTFHVGSDRLPEDRDALEHRIAGAITA